MGGQRVCGVFLDPLLRVHKCYVMAWVSSSWSAPPPQFHSPVHLPTPLFFLTLLSLYYVSPPPPPLPYIPLFVLPSSFVLLGKIRDSSS